MPLSQSMGRADTQRSHGWNKCTFQDIEMSAEIVIFLKEYCRPWKMVTFAVGLFLLIWGSFVFGIPDWDIGISIIMALAAYLFAPGCLHFFIERRWRYFPIAIFLVWFSVDGCYWLYWSLKEPSALALRKYNLGASLPLYFLCGCIWYYNGTLLNLVRELLRDVNILLGISDGKK